MKKLRNMKAPLLAAIFVLGVYGCSNSESNKSTNTNSLTQQLEADKSGDEAKTEKGNGYTLYVKGVALTGVN